MACTLTEFDILPLNVWSAHLLRARPVDLSASLLCSVKPVKEAINLPDATLISSK